MFNTEIFVTYDPAGVIRWFGPGIDGSDPAPADLSNEEGLALAEAVQQKHAPDSDLCFSIE